MRWSGNVFKKSFSPIIDYVWIFAWLFQVGNYRTDNQGFLKN